MQKQQLSLKLKISNNRHTYLQFVALTNTLLVLPLGN